MDKVISKDTLIEINDPDFLRYAQRYADIEQAALTAIERYGLPFNADKSLAEKSRLLKIELAERGAVFANNGKSIHINWLSEACVACRTGVGSHTSFLSLKCHRDCYFCFNPNQESFDYYNRHLRDAGGELNRLLDMGMPLTHAALTGGEPLLYKKESVAFFRQLNQRMPNVHSRLYTAGDPLDRTTAENLRQAGLKEIRFSIKIDDPSERQEKVLRRIALAREYIPVVMVEMPVLPGTRKEMRRLLLELDRIGVDGVNLLEFCFPFNNADVFKRLGFSLKYPPYQVYYNYWYAGGLAIAESELICLELMLFALEKRLSLGVHYCSLENKHTGQVYQQNIGYPVDDSFIFSERDYFFKCAKVFGKPGRDVEAVLSRYKQAFKRNAEHDFIQFNPSAIELLTGMNIEICLSSHIIESLSETEFSIKEVQLSKTTPSTFALAGI